MTEPLSSKQEVEVLYVESSTLAVTHIFDGEEVITGDDDGQVYVATFATKQEAERYIELKRKSGANALGVKQRPAVETAAGMSNLADPQRMIDDNTQGKPTGLCPGTTRGNLGANSPVLRVVTCPVCGWAHSEPCGKGAADKTSPVTTKGD